MLGCVDKLSAVSEFSGTYPEIDVVFNPSPKFVLFSQFNTRLNLISPTFHDLSGDSPYSHSPRRNIVSPSLGDNWIQVGESDGDPPGEIF